MRDSVMSMKHDMLELEIELRPKIMEKGMTTKSEQDQRKQELDFKLLTHVQRQFNERSVQK